MKSYEEQYLELLEKTLTKGIYCEDRTGTGCYKLFSEGMKVDLREGFPLLTTKNVSFDNVIGELLWFLNGKTDLPSLRKYQGKNEGAKTIWTDDFNKYWDRIEETQSAKESICLDRMLERGGLIYGSQLRDFNQEMYSEQVDQFSILIHNILELKKNPHHPMGRRLKCEFWNPVEHLKAKGLTAALPACHTGFQVVIIGDVLNLHFEMRSNDVFIGAPYNIASYAALAHIIAKIVGLEAGELSYHGADVHLYSNHKEQALEQLTRSPSQSVPQLVLPDITCIDDLLSLTCKDFKIENYSPQSAIKAPQAS